MVPKGTGLTWGFSSEGGFSGDRKTGGSRKTPAANLYAAVVNWVTLTSRPAGLRVLTYVSAGMDDDDEFDEWMRAEQDALIASIDAAIGEEEMEIKRMAIMLRVGVEQFLREVAEGGR